MNISKNNVNVNVVNVGQKRISEGSKFNCFYHAIKFNRCSEDYGYVQVWNGEKWGAHLCGLHSKEKARELQPKKKIGNGDLKGKTVIFGCAEKSFEWFSDKNAVKFQYLKNEKAQVLFGGFERVAAEKSEVNLKGFIFKFHCGKCPKISTNWENWHSTTSHFSMWDRDVRKKRVLCNECFLNEESN